MGHIFRQKFTKPIPEGAELFTRKGQGFARWTDARGKRQTAKLTETGDRIQRESAKYSARYRDGSGVVQTVPTGCRSRDAASAVLLELETRADKVKAGIRTAAEDSTIDHQATPIETHIEDYITDLKQRRGRGGKPKISENHVSKTEHNLTRIAQDCSFAYLRDLNREGIARWCKRQREQKSPLSERTLNDYLSVWTAFGNWLAEESRLVSNPFTRLIRKLGGDDKADRRRERRALTADELRRLLYTACLRPLAEYGRETVHRSDAGNCEIKASRRTWTKVPLSYTTLDAAAERGRNALAKRTAMIEKLEQTGRERALLYKTLMLTGLRKGELASLTVGQLELDTPTAYVKLAAADAKSGQAADIPLRADLTADLRRWIDDRLEALRDKARASGGAIPAKLPADQLVINVPDGLLRIFDLDIAAADIPKRDDRGRTADVHALRTSFCTHLSAGGVSPRTAQAAARHSTIELTMATYTDPQLLDVAGAMDVLPDLPLDNSPYPEQAKATGTDDSPLTLGLTSNAGNRCPSEGMTDQSTLSVYALAANNNAAGDCRSGDIERINDSGGMEQKGIEPLTSSLRTKRSPS